MGPVERGDTDLETTADPTADAALESDSETGTATESETGAAADDGDTTTAATEAADGTTDTAVRDGASPDQAAAEPAPVPLHDPNERRHTPDPGAGDVVIRANLAGTLLFGVTAALAAIFFTSFWQWVAAITAMALFAVGIFTFLWSYYNAVLRSRTDVISVTGLYLLLGPPTPPRVRRTMLLTLLLQFVIALVTTFARSHTENGSPGSSLALGFLVPMLGFGLNGLWAAYHADFPRREVFEQQRGS